MTLVSALLAATVSDWFLLLTAFVGVNQWLYVAFGACPASIVLRRACNLRSAIYPGERAVSPDAPAIDQGECLKVHATESRKEVTV